MSRPVTAGRLAEITARVEATTEGPWIVDPCESNEGTFYCVEPDDGEWGISPIDCVWRSDAEFIAHARTDVPDLTAEVDRLRSGIDALAATGEADGRGNSRDLSRRLRALLNPTEESA